MASTELIIENEPEPAVEIVGPATLFPDGVFGGATIVVKTAATQAGVYEQSAILVGNARRNFILSGGGWVKAEVQNPGVNTDLYLRINTP